LKISPIPGREGEMLTTTADNSRQDFMTVFYLHIKVLNGEDNRLPFFLLLRNRENIASPSVIA
jgi:hypothetical protein